MNRIETVVNELKEYSKTLDKNCQKYWEFHEIRYVWFINLLNNLLKNMQCSNIKIRVLDIAPLYQTLFISKMFDNITIDTFGYVNGPFHPENSKHLCSFGYVNGPFHPENSKHLCFDLNDSYYPDKWLNIKKEEKYDVIVMLEVIEHLSTSPTQVFSFLKQLLNDNGLLIIQTPNAVSLVKRFRMMKGINPFELIRENMRDDPGHFREYTRNELIYLASLSGLMVKEQYMVNYFEEGGTVVERFLDKVTNYLPSDFKSGMTIVFESGKGVSEPFL